MITEDYVSFKIAKLLKEKGFDEYCKSVYHVGSICSVTSLGYHNNEGYGEVIEEKQNSDFGKYDNAISAPTLQMVMKWLREVHKLYIVIRPYVTEEGFFSLFDIKSLKEKEIVVNLRSKTGFNTYEEACESAIKYCLENLI